MIAHIAAVAPEDGSDARTAHRLKLARAKSEIEGRLLGRKKRTSLFRPGRAFDAVVHSWSRSWYRPLLRRSRRHCPIARCAQRLENCTFDIRASESTVEALCSGGAGAVPARQPTQPNWLRKGANRRLKQLTGTIFWPGSHATGSGRTRIETRGCRAEGSGRNKHCTHRGERGVHRNSPRGNWQMPDFNPKRIILERLR